MPYVLFTPQFEGDEYHAPGLSVVHEGVIEVTDAQEAYLLTNQSKRFSQATVVEAEIVEEAPLPEPEALEGDVEAVVEKAPAKPAPKRKGKK